MDKALFMASQAASNLMRAQSVVANNMANTNTTGFKGDKFTMVSVEIPGGEFAARASARIAGGGIDLAQGPLQQTGRDLDVAISDRAMLSVQTENGEEAFTRRGDLNVSPEGILTDYQGRPILGEAGVIQVPVYESINVAADGNVAIVAPGGVNVLLDRLKMTTPLENADVYKGDDGLIRFKGEDIPDPDPNATVQSQFLEGSNVNGAAAMVDLMNLSRQFEINVNLMSRLDEIESSANDAISNS